MTYTRIVGSFIYLCNNNQITIHIMIKQLITAIAIAAISCTGVAQSTVYMTRDITPESLVKIYEAVGRKAHGKVAVKISTGEPGGHNYLKPELIKGLVQKVNGTIVECNTAYGRASKSGSRTRIFRYCRCRHNGRSRRDKIARARHHPHKV